MKRFLQCLLGLFAASMVLFAPMGLARDDIQRITTMDVKELPREGRETLALIKKGGPFPYSKDGSTFGNFERRLPTHERGYYKEYTVKTPGSKDRGARRIVAGKKGEYYYTADHYNTFKRVKE